MTGHLQDLREAYVSTLIELAEEDPRIVVVDADLANSILTRRFHDRFPDRAFQVGVAEQDLVGTAVGLALAGFVPFASSYAIFLAGRAWEQIRNAVDYGAVGVKLAGCHAGLSASLDGPTHMGIEDVALLANLDHVRVLLPADATDVVAAVGEAVRDDGPVYFRIHRNSLETVFSSPDAAAFSGREPRRVRDGAAGHLIAVGTTLPACLGAAKMLQEAGQSVSVHSLVTLDELPPSYLQTFEEAAVLVVEEHRSCLGVGAWFARQILEADVSLRGFAAKGIREAPGTGPEQAVRESLQLGPVGIAEAFAALRRTRRA